MFDGLKKLFGGDASPPEPAPRVRRRLFFQGLTQSEFTGLLKEFESLGRPGPAMNLELFGPEDDWFALALPEEMHPYTFHNLANWLLGTDGPAAEAIIAWSLGPAEGETMGAYDAQWSYYLIPESEYDDLIGYQADGTSLAIHVPDNQVFRGEQIALAPADADGFFRSRGVPANFLGTEIQSAAAMLVFHPEDPGDMNTRLESSKLTRAEARRSPGYI